MTTIWTVFHGLDPLTIFGELIGNGGEIVHASDGNRTVIGADGNVTIATDGDCSGGLGLCLSSESTGFVLPGLSLFFVDNGGRDTCSCEWVPLFDLIVISGGENMGLIQIKTPDFTFIMTLH